MTINERTGQLVRARTPFVHATVVRAQQPTSAHAGDEAALKRIAAAVTEMCRKFPAPGISLT